MTSKERRTRVEICADGREMPTDMYPKGWGEPQPKYALLYAWTRSASYYERAWNDNKLVEVYRAPGIAGTPGPHTRGDSYRVNGHLVQAFRAEDVATHHEEIPF